MNETELHELAARAHRAGHDSIALYCAELVKALVKIAEANSGVWGRIAHEALYGGRPVDRASRAVAARGHAELDERLADTIASDGGTTR
jgi:hypothetical protein